MKLRNVFPKEFLWFVRKRPEETVKEYLVRVQDSYNKPRVDSIKYTKKPGASKRRVHKVKRCKFILPEYNYLVE